jgi:hypothetical protein
METSSVTGEHSPRHPSSQRRHALGGCSWERGWGDGDHWTVTIWGILTHPKHHRWLVYHILSRRHFFKITVCNVFFFFFGGGGVEIWRLNPQPRGGLLSTILVGGSSIIKYIYIIYIYITYPNDQSLHRVMHYVAFKNIERDKRWMSSCRASIPLSWRHLPGGLPGCHGRLGLWIFHGRNSWDM